MEVQIATVQRSIFLFTYCSVRTFDVTLGEEKSTRHIYDE